MRESEHSQKKQNMRCEVFKITSDDWYPSYKLEDKTKLVQVSFMQILLPSSWLVCVWGQDDCGMEKFFGTENEAWCTFLRIIGLEDVTMSELTKLGLTSA